MNLIKRSNYSKKHKTIIMETLTIEQQKPKWFYRVKSNTSLFHHEDFENDLNSDNEKPCFDVQFDNGKLIDSRQKAIGFYYDSIHLFREYEDKQMALSDDCGCVYIKTKDPNVHWMFDITLSLVEYYNNENYKEYNLIGFCDPTDFEYSKELESKLFKELGYSVDDLHNVSSLQ